jgi:sulfatase modifying factor 1
VINRDGLLLHRADLLARTNGAFLASLAAGLVVLLCALHCWALPAKQVGEARTNPKDGMIYQWIPAGSFMMGCSPGDRNCQAFEKPVHRVTLTKGFWMGKTLVTVAAWKRYRAATGAAALPTIDGVGTNHLNEASLDDRMPVVFVTWDEANAFCGWAGMRLPTEAEWEYAARAGTTGARYGNLDEIAWFGDNTGNQHIDSTALFKKERENYFQSAFDNGLRPRPVGQKTPNAWQLHDMLGDVWEWVADWFDRNSYTDEDQTDPTGAATGSMRVLRGGSWYNFEAIVRVSNRGASHPSERLAIDGFRCAGNPDFEAAVD